MGKALFTSSDNICRLKLSFADLADVEYLALRLTNRVLLMSPTLHYQLLVIAGLLQGLGFPYYLNKSPPFVFA